MTVAGVRVELLPDLHCASVTYQHRRIGFWPRQPSTPSNVSVMRALAMLLFLTATARADVDAVLDPGEKQPRQLCGYARHRMAVLSAGNGDPKRGQLVLAQRYLKNAAGSEQRADALYDLWIAYAALGRHAQAKPVFDELLSIWRKHPSWASADYLFEIASILSDTHSGMAVQLFRWAIRACNANPECDVSSQTIYVEGLGELLHKVGRDREAEAQFRLALKIDRSEAHPPGSRGDALALHSIGITCAAQNKTAEAEAAFRESYDLSMGDDSEEVANILDDWSRLLRKTHQTERALKMETQVITILQNHIESQRGDAEANAPIARRIRQIERRR